MGIGVHHQNAIDHDADVPLPKYEVAALQAFETAGDGNTGAKLGLLHVGVARRRMPAACSEVCTSPEQSMPMRVRPPQRYGVPMKPLCDRHEISASRPSGSAWRA